MGLFNNLFGRDEEQEQRDREYLQRLRQQMARETQEAKDRITAESDARIAQMNEGHRTRMAQIQAGTDRQTEQHFSDRVSQIKRSIERSPAERLIRTLVGVKQGVLAQSQLDTFKQDTERQIGLLDDKRWDAVSREVHAEAKRELSDLLKAKATALEAIIAESE